MQFERTDCLTQGKELHSERTDCLIRGNGIIIRENEFSIRGNGAHNMRFNDLYFNPGFRIFLLKLNPFLLRFFLSELNSLMSTPSIEQTNWVDSNDNQGRFYHNCEFHDLRFKSKQRNGSFSKGRYYLNSENALATFKNIFSNSVAPTQLNLIKSFIWLKGFKFVQNELPQPFSRWGYRDYTLITFKNRQNRRDIMNAVIFGWSTKIWYSQKEVNNLNYSVCNTTVYCI